MRIDMPNMPEAPQRDRDPYEIDMSHTVYISGPHHILSNCQNDLPSVLSQWEWALLRLTNICRLLSRRYYKNRLIQTCFTGPNNVLAPDILKFYGKPHKARWGTTAAAACGLLGIFPILVHAWDKDAFMRRGQLEQRDDAHSCEG